MLRFLPVLLAGLFALPAQAAPLDAAGMLALLARFDEKMKSGGDFTARAFIEAKEKDKPDVAYDSMFYRHDKDDKFMILFLAPKAEAGKGYLRIDKNLWMYDPTVGKWDRRTERERIGGTTSQRGDFDPDAYATEFTHEYLGEEKLGRFGVHHIKLTAKEGGRCGLPGAACVVRHGEREPAQGAGARPQRPPDAHGLLPQVGEAARSPQQPRCLLCEGNQDLRRGGEGQ
jgi:hypothetical protein